jgi:PAS domain S-box-containing protein
MLKTTSKQSIIRIFLLSMLVVSFISIVVSGYTWINTEFRQFGEDAQEMRKEYIESQKLLVKNEVQRVIDYVDYMRSRIDRRLREMLKERVYEAHAIATNIYRQYRGQKSEGDMKRLIKEALRPVRFNKNRGYLYIYTLDGILELYPVKPQLEGENQLNLQDKQGNDVVKQEIAQVKNQREGFLEYTWKEPGANPDMIYSKVAFVKYFEPFNWYIGSKEYREDFIHDTQLEILERIGKIKFGQEGYIFAVNFDGVTLWNDIRPDLIGTKVWATGDSQGADTVRKAREAAKQPGGGFIDYTWFKLRGKNPIRKISFVMGIKDWQWIIGAGIYLDEIENVISHKRIELEQKVKRLAVKIIGLFLVIFVVVLLITLLFSRKLRKEFDVFLSFFKNSAVSHEKIDREKLFAEEFKILADSANRMLAERQKIENSLRESEERLAVTFRSLAEGVITTDTEQHVVLINRSAEQLTGWSQDKALGKPLAEVFHLVSEETREVHHPMEEGTPAEPCLVAGNGTKCLISHSSAPICDHTGKVMGSVIVFQDITGKKRLEEELQKAHQLEALGLLAGGIAHDFNNLLTGIMGNISLAKMVSQSGTKIHDILDQAEKASVKSKALIQQILTFASGGAPVKEAHAIAAIIKESVSFALRGSNVKCEFRLPPDLWGVDVDKDQVNQVFYNLVINAVQAMPGGGTVNLSAQNLDSGQGIGLPLADRKYVKVTIEDPGTGIPKDLLKKVFDPYFSTKPRGSGLGLASVYSIMQKHEGYVHVDSEPGKGATFTLYFPAAAEDSPGPGADTTNRGPGARVMIMDDDPIVGDVAVKMLDHLGYRPEVAHDGQQAVELYKKALEMNQPYQVVIMDLTIPGGMGGAEAVKELLTIDPHVKAIVSSGYSNDPIMANFRTYGFRSCIKKPYQLQELSKTLEEVVRSA